MKSTSITFFIFIVFINYVFGQTETFTDSRDGTVYNIIKIEDTKWFQQNLRYETLHSHCPNFNRRKKDCKEGNFYSFIELDTICPKGWKVASLEDWESYFQLLKEHKKVENSSLKYDTLAHEDNTVVISDTTKTIKIFENKNPLQLKSLGWVEGRKRKKMGTITIWALYPEDKKFHLHIGDASYVKHAHEHNIIDKPKRVRKFAVRCTCKDIN